MKKTLKAIITSLITLVLTLSLGLQRASLTELGIPSRNSYSPESGGLYALDLIIFDDKLYVGDGDYGTNTGPVSVMAYNLKTEQWENTGTLPDEAVRRFKVIDGRLTVPGTDPKDDWNYGNYYVLENGAWRTVRTIPGGIHNLDMISFDGKLFAALDRAPGQIPLACSSDGGKTFQTVEMIKNGEPLNTDGGEWNRCLDFILLNGELYTTYFYCDVTQKNIRYEFYRYDTSIGKFVYTKNILRNVKIRPYCGKEYFKSSVTFKDKVFIASGYLTVTSDMESFTEIGFERDETVWDLYVSDGTLYVLTSFKNEDGTFDISVWSTESGETDELSRDFKLTYDIPAVSFAVSSNEYFFSMYNNKDTHDKNGMIIRYRK